MDAMYSDLTSLQGYASPAYAQSLAAFGVPVYLPRCGGYLLKREIQGTPYHDAMGCYPMFFCRDWAGLADDLAELPDEIVSVSLVADPFGPYSREQLNKCFEVVNPYKQHYIVDLGCDDAVIGSDRHRKTARRALRSLQVEECKDPADFVDHWSRLYGSLVRRYDIRGIRAFSREAFAHQLGMPDIIVHQAFLGEEIVGAQLFFIQDDVAHCHLGAVSEQGYKAGAFYALDAFAFDYFKGRAKKVDLGGGSGLSVNPADGLSLYKRGWSTETRPVHFCGRIINPNKYDELAATEKTSPSGYFPAYRAGEFG